MRQATGRDDIWAVGLPTSIEVADTENGFWQFQTAYEADYVTPDGRLIIDEPEIRQRFIGTMDGYTAIQLKGCTPPDSVTWASGANNQTFLAQTVVMTPNLSLSIPNALERERPDDYYKNTATIESSLGVDGERFPIVGASSSPWVLATAGHVTPPRSSSGSWAEGWLIHYLDFSGERFLPSMSSCSSSRSGSTPATRTRWPR